MHVRSSVFVLLLFLHLVCFSLQITREKKKQMKRGAILVWASVKHFLISIWCYSVNSCFPATHQHKFCNFCYENTWFYRTNRIVSSPMTFDAQSLWPVAWFDVRRKSSILDFARVVWLLRVCNCTICLTLFWGCHVRSKFFARFK